MKRIGPKIPVKWFLREWRAHAGLTQEQLSERMGTNKGQINKLENSKQRMNDRWIAAYAEALGIDRARVLMDPNTPTADDLLRGATKEQVDEVRHFAGIIMRKTG